MDDPVLNFNGKLRHTSNQAGIIEIENEEFWIRVNEEVYSYVLQPFFYKTHDNQMEKIVEKLSILSGRYHLSSQFRNRKASCSDSIGQKGRDR